MKKRAFHDCIFREWVFMVKSKCNFGIAKGEVESRPSKKKSEKQFFWDGLMGV